LFGLGTHGVASLMRPHTISARVLCTDSEAVVNSLNDVHGVGVAEGSLEVGFLTVSKSVLEVILAVISEATD